LSEQLQLRRGTLAQVAAFTGAQGEVVVDTSSNRLVLQDGVTAGGFAAAKLSEAITTAGGQVAALGIGTGPDPGNPLSVAANNILFNELPSSSGGSGDIRIKLNKATTANTASFLFQNGFAGRAEIGLAGDDNFHFKVSADGSAWRDALSIAAATGAVSAAFVSSGLRTPAISAVFSQDWRCRMTRRRQTAFWTSRRAWRTRAIPAR
jgi:Major tropism determinant N-terminal domain